jgi:hypothetical protein
MGQLSVATSPQTGSALSGNQHLARQREPPAPLTILTPDALRLRHEPLADCARYDSLRRSA